jgi:sec-independent protein translocase protein TatB
MPGLGDGVFIFVLALLLFGPKKLPELARQVGKLMAEFRRASNEFRMQMEEELRVSEQAERQKKIAELEAAAPPAAFLDIPEPEHPHLAGVNDYDEYGHTPEGDDTTPDTEHHSAVIDILPEVPADPVQAESIPIASSGNLDLMPPSTGLPLPRSSSASLASAFESIPKAPDPEASVHG